MENEVRESNGRLDSNMNSLSNITAEFASADQTDILLSISDAREAEKIG